MLVLLPTQSVNGGGRLAEKDGTLVVLVTWGDVDNTPANDAYIEAHGFVRKSNSEKSFVLKSPASGRYETPFPPGVYDLFVSEGGIRTKMQAYANPRGFARLLDS